jgi:hypothetical protein
MKNKTFEDKIMNQIYDNQIKIKPKWWYLLKSGGLKGLWLLVILFASILISITIYTASIQTPLELWEFGDIGREIFFKDFPYLWFMGGLILLGCSVVLLLKIGENYKKTSRIILIWTILIIILATALLTLIGPTRNWITLFKLL